MIATMAGGWGFHPLYGEYRYILRNGCWKKDYRR